MKNDCTVTIGKILTTHGIKGWVAIQSYSHPPENIKNYNTSIEIDGKSKIIKIIHLKIMPKKIIVQFEGYEEINISEKLIGKDIFINASQIPSLDNGELYWRDIEGLSVVTTRAETIGVVDFIFNNGANDVMAIKKENSYVYIAYISENIVVVPKKEIIIDHETI